MKKISLILATVILLSLCLASCGSISFFSSSAPQATRIDEKMENDFHYAVGGDGAGGIVNGDISKVIISDGSGIHYGDESQGDDEVSGNNGSPDVSDDNNGNPDNGNEGTPVITNVKIGDYITFGAYEQDNNLSNGNEEIEWLVLDVKDGKALVISKYALDQKSMHTSYDTVSWETCALRKWLNSDFMNTAFSDAQKKQIALTSLAVDPEPEFNDPNSSYYPGNPTSDKVFFLSVTEANRYFANDAARVCLLTPYAATKNVNKMDGYAEWWLRNGGSYWDCFSWVSWNGYVFADGINGTAGGYTIRPAMWIEIG